MKTTTTCFAVTVALMLTSFATPAHALWRHSWRPLWPSGVVPVCYTKAVADQPNSSAFLSEAQNEIANTWGRYANLRFTGWGQCPATPPNGTMVIEYRRCGFNAQIGYNRDAPTWFFVDFNNKDTDGSCNSGDNSSAARWASIVPHEVGHVLGFEHDQDRDDNVSRVGGPSCSVGINRANQGSTDYFATPVDNDSVMSYCNGVDFGYLGDTGWTRHMSKWDRIGVQNAYGTKPAGSIVGENAWCVAAQSSALSAPLVSSQCNGAANDTWMRSATLGNHTFSASMPTSWYGPMCMDVPNAEIDYFGTPLQSYACNGSVAQQYTLDGVQWKALGDECVVARSTARNTLLEIQDCGTAGFYDKWTFDDDGSVAGAWRLKLAGTGMCVNVPYARATTGNPLQLYPCQAPAASNETFTSTDSGELVYGGMCLNVWGGTPTPGSAVALYPCSASSYNERFHVTGAIHGEASKCLDRDSLSGRIELQTCSAGSPSQSWDYYFSSRTSY
jgi:hypothetical protein